MIWFVIVFFNLSFIVVVDRFIMIWDFDFIIVIIGFFFRVNFSDVIINGFLIFGFVIVKFRM